MLRERDFRLLLGGQAVNMLGSWALLLVLGIWVKELTGSSATAGVVFLLFTVPAAMAPLTGLLVDRFPRRRVMIVNDLASAMLVLTLLSVDGREDVWLLLAVALGYGVSGQVYLAARGGLVHSMVADEDLGTANGLVGSLSQGFRVVGPLLGAGLYAAVGGAAVAVLDAATFAVSAGVLALLRPRDLRPGARRAVGLLRELSAGARHLAATPELRRLVGATAVALAVAGLLEVAMFEMVDDGLHRPATLVGVLSGFQGAGAVAGGLLAGGVLRRFGELRAAGVGVGVVAAGLAALMVTSLPVVLAGVVVVGFGVAVFLVAYLTLLQRRTDAALQGRVIAAAEAIIGVPYALSIALGAAIVELVDYRLIYLANALVIGVVGVFLLRSGRYSPPPAEPVAPAVPSEAA